jgi:surface polysaccharide O-acyltransferase-like enzyme
MIAYYYVCGNYILNKNMKKKKNKWKFHKLFNNFSGKRKR